MEQILKNRGNTFLADTKPEPSFGSLNPELTHPCRLRNPDVTHWLGRERSWGGILTPLVSVPVKDGPKKEKGLVVWVNKETSGVTSLLLGSSFCHHPMWGTPKMTDPVSIKRSFDSRTGNAFIIFAL